MLRGSSTRSPRADIPDIGVVGIELGLSFASPMESSQCMRESLAGQGDDFVVACLVEEFFHLLLANGESAESELHPLHGQCEQHE